MLWSNLLSEWHESEELKALQKKWYHKLKESGFEDIEDTNSKREYLKSWHSNYFYRTYTPETFSFKEEYYRRASQFLFEYHFLWFEGSSLINFCEREIWRLHSEGQGVRQIALQLQERGWKMNKDQVNRAIKRLVEVMKCWRAE